MAKTQHLKRRIRSIRNTMQVTRAMKMVSAARLRRAQDRIIAARPYARRMLAVLRSLAGRASHEAHPLLQEREVRRIEALLCLPVGPLPRALPLVVAVMTTVERVPPRRLRPCGRGADGRGRLARGVLEVFAHSGAVGVPHGCYWVGGEAG